MGYRGSGVGGASHHHSPHKFGHGHAVYALTMAKDVAALKAVSQNLMHQNLSSTDGVYGVLSRADIQKQIALLGRVSRMQDELSTEALIPLLEDLLGRLKGKRVVLDSAG